MIKRKAYAYIYPTPTRHYLESTLGIGGSSIVYLVRDLQATTSSDNTSGGRFALKELRATDKHEHIHFAFEGNVLNRQANVSTTTAYGVWRLWACLQSPDR